MTTAAMLEVDRAIRKSMGADGVAENLTKILEAHDCTVEVDYARKLLRYYSEWATYRQERRGRVKRFVSRERVTDDNRQVHCVDGRPAGGG